MQGLAEVHILDDAVIVGHDHIAVGQVYRGVVEPVAVAIELHEVGGPIAVHVGDDRVADAGVHSGTDASDVR